MIIVLLPYSERRGGFGRWLSLHFFSLSLSLSYIVSFFSLFSLLFFLSFFSFSNSLHEIVGRDFARSRASLFVDG